MEYGAEPYHLGFFTYDHYSRIHIDYGAVNYIDFLRNVFDCIGLSNLLFLIPDINFGHSNWLELSSSNYLPQWHINF